MQAFFLRCIPEHPMMVLLLLTLPHHSLNGLSRDFTVGRKNSNTVLLANTQNMLMSSELMYPAFQVHLLPGSLRIKGVIY